MEVKIVSNSGIDIHNQTDIMRILDPVILIHAMFRVVLTFCWIQVVPDAKCSAPRPESVSACTECDRQAWAWHGNLVSTNHDTCNAYMILYVYLYSLYNYILLQRSRCTVHDYMYTYLYMFRCCCKLTFLRVIRRFRMFKPNISSDLFTSWKSLIIYDKFTSEFCAWFRCGDRAGHCSGGWVQYARACGSLRRQLTLKCWPVGSDNAHIWGYHRFFPATKSMRQESHPRHKKPQWRNFQHRRMDCACLSIPTLRILSAQCPPPFELRLRDFRCPCLIVGERCKI